VGAVGGSKKKRASDGDGGEQQRGQKRKGWPRALRPARPKTTLYRKLLTLDHSSSNSQSCARFACFASSVRSAIKVPFCCVFLLCVSSLFNASSPADMRSRELSTIEVIYLSFRRSRDAPGSRIFVLMVVIVFSTLLYVCALLLCWPDSL
jgi:hypothetical protein